MIIYKLLCIFVKFACSCPQIKPYPSILLPLSSIIKPEMHTCELFNHIYFLNGLFNLSLVSSVTVTTNIVLVL